MVAELSTRGSASIYEVFGSGVVVLEDDSFEIQLF